ncbi:MAG: biopolymer transporter ExbD [Verrucomicrobiota bacterium]
MKFPRNARIFRGQFDATPYASVFFLMLMFVLLGSLLYTPGVRVELPSADAEGLPGTDQPTLSVAVDAAGRFYYENQAIAADALQSRLKSAAAAAGVPMTLVVRADKSVTEEKLIRLALLARQAGIQTLLLATLPQPLPAAAALP